MSNVMMIHNCTIPFIVVVVGSGCGFSVWAVNSIEFLMSTQEGIEIGFDYVVSIYVRLFQLQANFFCCESFMEIADATVNNPQKTK